MWLISRLSVAIGLIAIVIVPVWGQWQFEHRLNRLQAFCATLPGETTKIQAEARLRATPRLSAVVVRWSDDPARQSLIIHDADAEGWVCELALENGLIRTHLFGADHGARRSWIDRSRR